MTLFHLRRWKCDHPVWERTKLSQSLAAPVKSSIRIRLLGSTAHDSCKSCELPSGVGLTRRPKRDRSYRARSSDLVARCLGDGSRVVGPARWSLANAVAIHAMGVASGMGGFGAAT